jgi:hypothetical protein
MSITAVLLLVEYSGTAELTSHPGKYPPGGVPWGTVSVCVGYGK